MELAELDVTFHYKFTPHWGGYVVLSGVNYSGGFLDSGIEGFHDVFGFDNNGRPAVQRNDVNLIADLKSTDMAFLGAPTHGGMLDPTIGVRYSGIAADEGLEYRHRGCRQARVAGPADFLSTGKSDFGVQATLQRFGNHHAWYVSASGVYYDGTTNMTPTDPQIVPTLIVGYERKLSRATHLILQATSATACTRTRTPTSTSCSTEVPVERRGLSPLRAQRDVVRDHREPAELQQHAGRRPAARLGLQPGARAPAECELSQAGWTFAFRRNRFVGSYFFLISRSRPCCPGSCRRSLRWPSSAVSFV